MSTPFNCLKKYSLEIAVFLCGAAVMALELVGTRLFSPQFGTSLYVWASIIGVVLGSLSIGYWYGGSLSKKDPSEMILARVIALSSVAVLMIYLAKDLIFQAAGLFVDIRVSSFIAAAGIFAVPSFLLGIVSPYAARLKIMEVGKSGEVVGNLYAISTVGSIAGTFLTGFWLIGAIGSGKIILGVAVFLALASLIVGKNKFLKINLLLLLAIVSVWAGSRYPLAAEGRTIDIETEYGRYFIDDKTVDSQKIIRSLRGSRFDSESAMYIVDGNPSDELVFLYTKYFLLGGHFQPDMRKALVIGGGAYSFPKEFLNRYPGAVLDVVEIDPDLTIVAKEYFNLKDDPRMRIINEDGRVFLNRNAEKYDCIYMDAFSATYSIPYHLTTREAVQRVYNSLDNEGVAIANIISGLKGDNGKFLRAEYYTYKSVFPQVYLFPVKETDGNEVINYVVVALKSPQKPDLESNDPEINGYLENLWTSEVDNDIPILTDDFAPTDQYIGNMLYNI